MLPLGAFADTGIVRLYNDVHGFGFINPDGEGLVPLRFSGQDVEFPADGSGLNAGDCVSYRVTKTADDSYPTAIQIHKIECRRLN